MTPLFWLDIIITAISTIIALSLAFMVIGAGPGRGLNRLFALFALAETTWAASHLVTGMAFWLGKGDPIFWQELSTLNFAFTSPLLLLFTIRYVGRSTKWVDVFGLAGVAIAAASSIPMFRHQLIWDTRLDVNGIPTFNLTLLGYASAALIGLYYVWSLVLFWGGRQRTREVYLALSMAILLIGLVARALLPAIPVTSVTALISITILGYGVISQQILNPLRELTTELESKVEERTRELAGAKAKLEDYSQTLEQRVAERTAENVRLLENERVRLRRQAALFRLSAQVAAAISETDICQCVVEGLHDEAVGYDYVGLFLVDEITGDRVLRATDGREGSPVNLRVPPGRGLSERPLLDGQLHYTPDVTRDSHYVPGLSSGSEADVPICMNEKVMGVLVVESAQPNAFSQDDFEILTVACQQAGLALGRAGQLVQTQQRVSELGAINSISQALVSELKIDALIELIGEKIRQTFNAQVVFIALLDSQTNLIHFPYLFDRGQRVPDEPIKFGKGMTSHIMQLRRPVMINQDWAQRAAEYDAIVADGVPAKASLGVPIIVGDEAIGAISLQSMDYENVFSEADVHLLTTIAANVGVAIKNARLFEKERAARVQAETLQAAVQALSATLDLQQIFELILSELQRVVPYDTASVQEFRDGRMVIIGGRGFPNLKEFIGLSFDPTSEENPASHVISARAPHIIDDASARYSEFRREPHATASIRGWMGVPLLFGDRLIGLISLDKHEPGFYTPEHARLALAFAAQAAVAIENARLYASAQQQKQYFEALVQNSPIAIVAGYVDEQHQMIVMSCNPAFESLFGYPKSECIGRNLDELIVAQDTRVEAAGYSRQALEGLVHAFTQRRRKDGALVEVELFGVSVQGAGDRQAVLGLYHDITERKRAEEALRLQNEYLNALHETTLGLVSRLDLTDLLEAIVTRAGALVGTPHGYIYLLEPDGTEMKVQVGTGSQARYVGQSIKAGEGLSGKVWQTGQPLAVNDYWAWSGRLPTVEASRAVAGVPLKSGSQVVGVIGMVYQEEGQRFGEAEIEILTRFAGLASIALDNARLYAAVQQELAERKRTEEALHDSQRQLEASYLREQERRRLSDTLREVAKIVSGTLEQQTVVDLILMQLEKVVTCDHASVTLLVGDELVMVAKRDWAGSSSEHYIMPVEKYPLNAAVLRDRKPILLPDVTQDERWRFTSDTAMIRSFINAPLLVQDRPIGVLAVGRSGETSFTEDEAQTVFAFAGQVAVALESTRLHAYELAQVERELEFARQIQMSLLPSDAPEMSGLEIAGFSEAARHAGGDFYNYFVFDHEHVGIAVGDVSGKGMQAALMMALSFGLLTNQVRRDVAPAALLAEMNKEIRPHTKRNNLNTALCYLTIRFVDEAWQVRVANAGLIAPLVRHANGTVEWLNARGWPLGMVERLEYQELEHQLVQGDVLILSSDGIVEAMDTTGEMYGFDRLLECVAAAPGHTAQALQEWILNHVRAFVGDAETHDDLTLIVVAVTEPWQL